MALKRECDQCKSRIKEGGVKIIWDSGEYSYPKQSHGTFDFCNLRCLRQWVETRTAKEVK